jgi:riboflavin kinase/FMN adenylyltransferase
MGIEIAVVADFKSVMPLSPIDFVKNALCCDLGCAVALTGEGFRFGKGARGDASMLRELIKESGGSAITVKDISFSGAPVSSTRIREALSLGKIEEANTMLSSPFFIRGTVERGLGEGRLWGFPTVNIGIAHNSPIANGVYKSSLKIGDKVYTGLTNIGVCPTFGKRERHAETTILNYSGELYGNTLDIQLIKFIREERMFESPTELAKQIQKDIKKVREI